MLASPSVATLERAAAVAQRVWRPACSVVVSLDPPPNPDWLGWSWPGDCRVHVSIEDSDLRSFAPLCTVVLHEVGHVVGWRDPVTESEHSANPRSVMYPVQGFGRVRRMPGGRWHWMGADPRCGGVR